MPQPLPNYTAIDILVPNYRKFGIKPQEQGPDIMIDSTATDGVGGHTPTFQIRPGTMVVLKTSTGTYFPAAQAGTGADTNKPAVVTSTGTGDATWNSAVMTFVLKGGQSFTVTLGGATATAAAAATNLNANAIFAANFVATANGSNQLVVTTLQGGADEYFTVSCSATSMYGNTTPNGGQGSDADYRITEDFVYLQDENGNAINGLVMNTQVGGSFITPNLLQTNAEG